jgi:hypothetical protein
LAAYRGCQVQAWPLVETETGWRMDLDRLAELLTPNTRLLVLNVPHNPTGYKGQRYVVFKDDVALRLPSDNLAKRAALNGSSHAAVSFLTASTNNRCSAA